MKILQIVNPAIPLPAETIGGTERIVQYIIEELVKQGHEVTFMGHNDSVLPAGVKLIKIGTYLDRDKTIQKIWRHLLAHKYDVIHNHGRLLHFLPVTWGSTRKVHTFHMGELDGSGLQQFIKMRPRNFTFVPCGGWIKQKYQHLGGNWQVVNNGLPADKYKGTTATTGDAPLVIMCRLGATKGVTEAINIAIATGKKLLIAGKVGDYPHEIEWFETQVQARCDGTQIKFIGMVNDAEKQQLLGSAAALLIPVQTSEAFNTTMIEANACGCPVITYNRYCFPEFITGGVNGFLGENEHDLIKAVSHLPEIDRVKCREIFEAGYTSQIMVANYLKIYNKR
jgi:glycosyltransferase involved in cell wall biosynthesis